MENIAKSMSVVVYATMVRDPEAVWVGGVGMGFRAMRTLGSSAASTMSKLCYFG